MSKHDFATDTADAVEALDANTIKQLRIALKKAPGVGQVDVDDLSDAEVIDAADEAGIIDLDKLRDKYEERNPEVHREGDERPQGLDTPTSDEISPKDLLVDDVQHNVARGAGVELDGTDLATKAAQIRAAAYSGDRELAEAAVDHRQDVDDPSKLTDAELRDLVEEEAQKILLGQQNNPNDLNTVVEHLRASHIGRLTTQHGYAREDLNDLSLNDLVVLEAKENADANAAGTADAAAPGAAVESATDGIEIGGAAESAAGDGGANADGASSGDAGSTDADDSQTPPPTDPTPDEPDNALGANDTVTVETSIHDGDSLWHKTTDGRWFDEQGNEVTSPDTLRVLDDHFERLLAQAEGLDEGSPGGTVDSVTPTGTSHEDAVEQQSADTESESDSDEDSDSDSDSDSDDDDDSDDDGDDDDETEDAEAVEGDEEEGETTESEGGNTAEGTPNPLGDDPIDPADQARFDESVFGDEQRQEQVDAIDDRAGHAGGPDDDPSDIDTATFLDTKAGAEAAETLADGVEHHRDGGDTDPADLDAVESNGEVVEIKVSGGGLTDPVDDGPTAPPSFGDGVRGNPIVDGPPITTGPDRFGSDEADVRGDSSAFDQFEIEAAAVDPFEGLDTDARGEFDEVDVATEIELDDVDLVAD